MIENLGLKNRGIIVGADRFTWLTYNGEHPLKYMQKRSPAIFSLVDGLWVSRTTLDDDKAMEEILEVVNQRYVGTEYVDNPRTIPVIYDLSSSGGTKDSLGHVGNVIRNYPADKMLFTVSVTEGLKGMRALREKYANDNVGFLLQGIYPEDSAEDVSHVFSFRKDDDPITEEEITSHFSNFVVTGDNGVDFDGMTGFGRLAPHTSVGQLYLALGVSIDEDVDNPTQLATASGDDVVEKRACGPEETFQYATNTLAVVSRTLFVRKGEAIQLPEKWQYASEEQTLRIATTVAENLAHLRMRLDALPPPRRLKK